MRGGAFICRGGLGGVEIMQRIEKNGRIVIKNKAKQWACLKGGVVKYSLT